jgi:hypothetical protein
MFDCAEGDAVWKKIIHTKLALPLRYEVIEDLFSQRKTEQAGGDAQDTAKKQQQQPTEVNLLDMKRSMAINICLKQFKAPNDEIIALIRNGEAEKIGVDKLKMLLKILPESDEVLSVKPPMHVFFKAYC